MHACTGDRIVMKGHHAGEHERDCLVVGVRGKDGGPPYVVRWDDSDRESLFFPGADAVAEHFEHSTK